VRGKNFDRIINIPTLTELAIRKYFVHIRKRGVWLFTNIRGERLSSTGVYVRMRDFFKSTKRIRDRGPRAIGHSFLRTLFESGLDTITIRNLSQYKHVKSVERQRPLQL